MSTLHVHTLLAMHAAGSNGVTLSILLIDLRRGAHRNVTLPQLEKVARDLADKSFASPRETMIGDTRWCCTSKGQSALEDAEIL